MSNKTLIGKTCNSRSERGIIEPRKHVKCNFIASNPTNSKFLLLRVIIHRFSQDLV